jgi:hypothetical protein
MIFEACSNYVNTDNSFSNQTYKSDADPVARFQSIRVLKPKDPKCVFPHPKTIQV